MPYTTYRLPYARVPRTTAQRAHALRRHWLCLGHLVLTTEEGGSKLVPAWTLIVVRMTKFDLLVYITPVKN